MPVRAHWSSMSPLGAPLTPKPRAAQSCWAAFASCWAAARESTACCTVTGDAAVEVVEDDADVVAGDDAVDGVADPLRARRAMPSAATTSAAAPARNPVRF